MVTKLGIMSALVFFTFACSSQQPIDYEQQDLDKSQASATASTDDDDDEACLTDGATKDTHGFSLAGEQYDGDLDEIIANNCAGCHRNTQPLLRDYDEIAANLADIKRTINLNAGDADVMPPAGPIGQDDINRITTWIDAGAPQIAPDEPEEDEEDPDAKEDEDEEDDDKDSDDDEDKDDDDKDSDSDKDDDDDEDDDKKKKKKSCSDKDDNKDDEENKKDDNDSGKKKEWDESIQLLLDVDKVDECHDKDQAYDRRTSDKYPEGRCDDAEWPATFECNRGGVEKAFGNSSAIKQALDKAEDEGFEVDYPDQCGNMDDGRPVVFLVKGIKAKGDDPAQLFVRIIRAPE